MLLGKIVIFLTTWAVTWDFQQCGILTSVDSGEPVQPPFKLWNSKWCSVSSLTLIEYSSDQQRFWSDCAYAQADLWLCWSHIPHCWKSHVVAHIFAKQSLYCFDTEKSPMDCFCLFWCFMSQSTNFQKYWDDFLSSCVKPVLSSGKSVLLKVTTQWLGQRFDP